MAATPAPTPADDAAHRAQLGHLGPVLAERRILLDKLDRLEWSPGSCAADGAATWQRLDDLLARVERWQP